MLITSHLAATLLISEGLSLSGPELIAALAGGVALDIDHLFVNKKWISDIKGFLKWISRPKDIFKDRGIVSGQVNQHSWLQEPVFGLTLGIVLGILISILFPAVRWWVFPLFQAIHIAMDAIMKFEHRPLWPASTWSYRGFVPSGSKMEWLSFFVVIAILLVIV